MILTETHITMIIGGILTISQGILHYRLRACGGKACRTVINSSVKRISEPASDNASLAHTQVDA